MLVDASGSIGSTNMASVRAGITAFIDSFAGTPIKLEIVRFSATASTLGGRQRLVALLRHCSATAPAIVDNSETGLPISDGNNFHQVSWTVPGASPATTTPTWTASSACTWAAT